MTKLNFRKILAPVMLTIKFRHGPRLLISLSAFKTVIKIAHTSRMKVFIQAAE